MADGNRVNDNKEKPYCGIVMPISSIDGCSASHWADVKGIVEDSIVEAGYRPRLVSDADDAGVIQKRIIQNLYHDCIVVCDVSAKNPNVMFELGIRLAFNKPTIIIKDDKTDYSFDTSVIEHLLYPRDLRFSTMVDFKSDLTRKILATVDRSKDADYTTFLGHFGEFKVAEINEKEITADKFVIDSIKKIMQRLETQENSINRMGASIFGDKFLNSIDYNGRDGSSQYEELIFRGVGADKEYIEKMRSIIKSFPSASYEFKNRKDDLHLRLGLGNDSEILVNKLVGLYEEYTG